MPWHLHVPELKEFLVYFFLMHGCGLHLNRGGPGNISLKRVKPALAAFLQPQGIANRLI